MKVRTHFRIETDIKNALDTICKEENKSQSEMIEKIILWYRLQKEKEDEKWKELQQVNQELLEYVTLLVKGNQQLPKEEKDMQFLVTSQSRFAPIIDQKIKKKE